MQSLPLTAVYSVKSRFFTPRNYTPARKWKPDTLVPLDFVPPDQG